MNVTHSNYAYNNSNTLPPHNTHLPLHPTNAINMKRSNDRIQLQPDPSADKPHATGKQRQELLIHGYIRQNYNKNNIPNDILLFILSWYNTSFFAYIKNDLQDVYMNEEHEIKLNDDISLIFYHQKRFVHQVLE